MDGMTDQEKQLVEGLADRPRTGCPRRLGPQSEAGCRGAARRRNPQTLHNTIQQYGDQQP